MKSLKQFPFRTALVVAATVASATVLATFDGTAAAAWRDMGKATQADEQRALAQLHMLASIRGGADLFPTHR